ncbi:uncharacterized protein LOC132557831 [Ylistrum balloti]|uniref:uncharacterized protein LOC132557831 n=1 Tax=Ylistrum balloti TaxID=509963 RepID=UPI0029059E6B|nr:uncharacterized protein LOC132557831 [Ylistrum balloti]
MPTRKAPQSPAASVLGVVSSAKTVIGNINKRISMHPLEFKLVTLLSLTRHCLSSAPSPILGPSALRSTSPPPPNPPALIPQAPKLPSPQPQPSGPQPSDLRSPTLSPQVPSPHPSALQPSFPKPLASASSSQPSGLQPSDLRSPTLNPQVPSPQVPSH